MTKCLNIMSDLKHFSEPEFYGDLVHKFRKIIGKYDFSHHFKKIIFLIKKIGYSINVLRQSAYLLVNPINMLGCKSNQG